MTPVPTWWRSTVVQDDVELAVREAGDATAPTVILVHGFPDTSTVWDEVAVRLAEHHHVVLYDVRVGRLTRPRGRRAFCLAHLSADLVAVMDATAGDQQVHLVGHDWGSVQAWETVTDPVHQARSRSYTTISGPCLDHGSLRAVCGGRPRATSGS